LLARPLIVLVPDRQLETRGETDEDDRSDHDRHQGLHDSEARISCDALKHDSPRPENPCDSIVTKGFGLEVAPSADASYYGLSMSDGHPEVPGVDQLP
jgi:hypothetical protein